MEFEDDYSRWLEAHIRARKGEALRRLREGHGHAEQLFLKKVWYPAFRDFAFLYPEYEIHEFKDGQRYLDFVYIKPPFYACRHRPVVTIKLILEYFPCAWIH